MDESSGVWRGQKQTGLDYPIPAGYRSLGIISQSTHGAVYKVTQPPCNEIFALKVIHCPDPRVASNLSEALKGLVGVKLPGLVGVREVMQMPHLVACVMEWTGDSKGSGRGARTGADLIASLCGSPSGNGTAPVDVHGLASDRLWPALGLDPRVASPLLARAARPPTPYMSLVAAQFAGLARGLELCHQLGIIHGDIKPANIHLRESGELALGDFGSLTHLEQPGIVAGTPKYLAPERLGTLGQGALPSTLHAPDRRSDVWSLGVCLFELLTLTSAFEAATSVQMYRAIATLDVPSPRSRHWLVPQALEDVCRVSTQRNPDERYATAGQMADALDAFVHAGIPAESNVSMNMTALQVPSALVQRVTGVTAWLRNQLSHLRIGKGVEQ